MHLRDRMAILTTGVGGVREEIYLFILDKELTVGIVTYLADES